jgi:hypothetical protein
MPAFVLVSGIVALDMDPHRVPGLLSGVRSAAELLGCSDPLPNAASLLSTSLRRTFPEAAAAAVFTRLISELAPEDRDLAFGNFLGA